MRVTKSGTFLTQLTNYPKFFPVNCYLVEESDGLTLIDTGLPGSEGSILKAAAAIGKPIVRIALTHAHMDHVGSLDASRVTLPTAEISISTRDSRPLAGDMALDSSEPSTNIRGQFVKVTTVPSRLLVPGDRVGSLEVIATPGHTPGHVAYFDHRDRTVIAGDSWQTAGGIAVSGLLRFGFPWLAIATWDKGLALQSAKTLLALNPSRLAAGHGDVLESPSPAMKKAIATAERRYGVLSFHALKG